MRLENTFVAADGVGEATERRLWDSGVRTWDEFDPAPVGPGRADAVRSFLGDARDRLAARDADYFAERLPAGCTWRLYRNFRDEAAFFDIETTGLDAATSVVTAVSVHRGGDTETFVRGEDLDPAALRSALDAPLLVSFNGKRFDVPFLEDCLGLSLDRPHLDLMYPCRRLELTGGLKPAERALGVERELPDVDGEEAVRLWRRHERGDPDALDRLVAYNREDAVNLRELGDRVTDRLHENVFPHA
jgi:uncharacterized protein YprB with RNaseH-like and TPR domain